MTQLGRISGPLLKDNLLRDGEDLAFEDNLLYLNVNDGRIGINTDIPNRNIRISGTTRTNYLIVDTQADIADISIFSNQIQTSVSRLNFTPNQALDPKVTIPQTLTNNILSITAEKIENIVADSNIEITANGIGEVHFTSELVNVNGNFHATSDITFDGDITFGDSNSDNVSFAADINSNIFPNFNNTYDLGSPSQEWKTLYSHDVTADTFTVADSFIVNNTELLTTQGQVYYVAINGDDTYTGNHFHDPFRSVKHALSVATSGDTIHIFPGTYQEIFPMTVPTGVSVKGMSIRSVTIVPTVATNDKDAFLLNGETTIADLTVSNFFYNSTNNTGYAFRFADGAKTTTRSPYIQNCSVITKGRVVTVSDPLGFDEGDAGRGALVDGSVCDSTTFEAAMLFHGVTLIVPNADAVTMTNGVRVEWLNSFTYFANRSLYATNGALGLAGLGVKFGAEIRAIGSASVYGNYGAWADGASTLMYLIQHNFAYIASSKDSSNDSTLHIKSHEATELNSGKIYYQSFDHDGEFRVGNAFYVNSRTGATSIVIDSGTLLGLGSLTLTTGTDTTYIDFSKIETGNLVFRDNTIQSYTGPVNFISSNNEFHLTQNVAVSKNIGLAGDMLVRGTLTFGNQVTDDITFTSDVSSDMIPSLNNFYNLGRVDQRWDKVYLDNSYIDNIHISNNAITSINTNTNLQIKANGSGTIIVPYNSVDVTNDFTVYGLATTKSVNITGDITQAGDYTQIGAAQRTGDTDITGNLTVRNIASFQNVQIVNNNIKTTITDTDLQFDANGTGIVNVLNSDVRITNNLDVPIGTSYFSTTNVTTTVQADAFDVTDVYINDNYITTLQTNQDLQLLADGTGKIYAPLKDVQIVNDLTVDGTTTVKAATITGDIDLTGDWNQIGNTHRTGNTDITGTLTVTEVANLQNVKIETNVISATATDSDLIIDAIGTGEVVIPTNNVRILNDLRVEQTANLHTLNVTNTVQADAFDISDVYINDNYITTLQPDQNLLLEANGTGKIYVPLKNVAFDQNAVVGGTVTVNGATSLKDTEIIGNVQLVGNFIQTGDVELTGDFQTLNLNIVNPSYFQFSNLRASGNKIEVTDTDTDLNIIANGTGAVLIESRLKILNDTISNVWQSATTDLQKSIIFSPNGTGNVVTNTVKSIQVPVGDNTNRVLYNYGEIRLNSSHGWYEGYLPSGPVSFNNLYDVDKNTYITAELTPGANDKILRFGINGTVKATIDSTKLYTNIMHVDNVRITGNTINHLTTNDINFVPQGTGVININNMYIKDNTLTNNLSSALSFANTGNGYNKILGSAGVVIPSGPSIGTVNAELGMIRYDTDTGTVNVYDGTAWVSAIGSVSTISYNEVENILDLWTLVLG